MDITYLGHSSFKIAGKVGTVVTDPYNEYVGFSMPKVAADVVTISHAHPDHNEVGRITATARREKPFIISELGEYEVAGISVFGVKTFHDAHQGVERGINTVYTILIDGIRICHLGDLGHELTTDQLSEIGDVDVVLCPVGGHFTIDPVLAVKTINILEPSYAIPMHYRTDQHDDKVFSDLKTLQDFLTEYGAAPAPVAKLSVDKGKLPEETELVVLQS
ncbi:MAG TPA: MBL fold metallo-hydrolase [Vitreimonas sp.]|nr:MBL fold metallo-hydrolase [Vitreimonas sp.]